MIDGQIGGGIDDPPDDIGKVCTLKLARHAIEDKHVVLNC
ncbi:hypothetical protein MY1884_008407, partial [Beauveria asiatica]